MVDTKTLASQYYEDFNRFADSLYPNRYSLDFCLQLAWQTLEIKRLAQEKNSKIVVHYYLYPEFHEIADKLGDSLALSRYINEVKTSRVDFQAVFFMAATAKMLAGDATRVFVSGGPEELGCSLVFGTNHLWLESWKRKNPEGLLVTYINSDAYTKSISDFISTSRNTAQIVAHAATTYPGRKILILPDKFLGYVMKAKTIDILKQKGLAIDPELIEIYEQPFGGFNACCYVHEQFGHDAIEVAMIEHPEAKLMVHPECGCASQCMYKLQKGIIPNDKAFIMSTEQMIQYAMSSESEEFIVSTEPGLLYALRKRLPDKKFIPVSAGAHCQYMKANTFDKLLWSLREDRLEVVLCDNCKFCTDPKVTYRDERTIHIPREIANLVKPKIEVMNSLL